MTDRYENIRKALADMDAATEARNALAWFDAHARFVVHIAPDTIRKLLAERNQLAAALEAAQMGLRYAVRVWVLSDEITWSKEEIDDVVENIISDAKKESVLGGLEQQPDGSVHFEEYKL